MEITGARQGDLTPVAAEAGKELKRTATLVVDQAREAAVAKVVCPICFEALSDYPDQVGALTFEGHRVESALYHSSCVLNRDTGKLVFQTETGSAVSPLTRVSVDGFKLMPSLTKAKAWTKFVNWEQDQLDVQKVSSAVCALLPVDECDARKFVLMELGLPEDRPADTELKPKEVVDSVLPAVRRQLRRLVETAPKRNAPELCRNSTQDELKQWFQFWDAQTTGFLDHATLHLAVTTAFHTALAKSADPKTKAAVANAFFAEIGLRECEAVSVKDFTEKLAPQLLANLPVAYGRGWPSGAPVDPKQPLTLKLREMRSGAERPVHFEVAGEVLVGDLRHATHRRFPVILSRNEVKLYVMGQLLDKDEEPLFTIRGIYDGATVTFMPGKTRLESKEPSRCNTQSKQKLRMSGRLNHNDVHLSDLEDLDTEDEDDDLEVCAVSSNKLREPTAEVSPSGERTQFSRQVSPEDTACSAMSAKTWAEGDHHPFARQTSNQSRCSCPERCSSKASMKAAPMQVASDPQMGTRRKKKSASKERVKECMPRVSKRCTFLLDDWSPHSPHKEWRLPSNKEKAKIPKSTACVLLGA